MAESANKGRRGTTVPTPAKLKLLEGRGHGRDSGGRLVQEPPAFKRLPPAKPDDLSEDAAQLWDQFVAELSRLSLVKPLDGAALEILCETYARWKRAKRERIDLITKGAHGGRVADPLVGIEERASKDFRAWCAEFGLTPAAEAKLSTPDADGGDDANPFADG